MKSDAEIMPGTDADSLSHRGADAKPWSCSAWNACREGRQLSSAGSGLQTTAGALRCGAGTGGM